MVLAMANSKTVSIIGWPPHPSQLQLSLQSYLQNQKFPSPSEWALGAPPTDLVADGASWEKSEEGWRGRDTEEEDWEEEDAGVSRTHTQICPTPQQRQSTPR